MCLTSLFITYKAIPLQAWTGPEGFQESEAPRFHNNRHMKVVSLSALSTGRLYTPGNIPGSHFCYRLSQPQGHNAAGRIMSIKNSSDTIGNLTRDLPTCSAAPQPTTPPRNNRKNIGNIFSCEVMFCNCSFEHENGLSVL